MQKWLQNYILFVIMFLLALFQAVSGLLMWLVIPGSGEGFQGGRDLDQADAAFIWPRHTWIDLHDWTAVALIVMVVIHLILHWKWIVYTTKKAFSIQQ
jgi:hypothetical protein